MKVMLFSMFDRVAGVYLTPFPSRSVVDAVRQIRSTKDDPAMKETPMFSNPSDFELTSVGTFDDETGDLQCERPRRLHSVAEIWADKPSGTVSP